MKTWKLCLAVVVVAVCSCQQPKKNTTPAIFTNLEKRYPELYPDDDIRRYHLEREIFDVDGDSVKMQLFIRDNSGRQIIVFINKIGKSYAFPMPENAHGDYWRFDSEAKTNVPDDKTFESEFHQAFKVLSLDEGWGAYIIFQDFASLLQTRIVFGRDSLKTLANKKQLKSCDTAADRRLKIMYQDVLVVLGLTANTFYDYNHGRYYQFHSNMQAGSRGFKVKVYRAPCWVEPFYL